MSVLSTEDPENNEDYRSLVKHINVWKRTGADWDDYRARIDSQLLEKWRHILRRCIKEGFYLGGIEFKNKGFRIFWKQVVSYPGIGEGK